MKASHRKRGAMMGYPVSSSGRCAFVVNVPIRVESDSEMEDSSDEEVDGNFSDDCFENPLEHFRLHPGKAKNTPRGLIIDPSTQQRSIQSGKESQRVQKLYQKFKEEDKKLGGKLLTRTKIVLGPNKMRSLSRSRNRSLESHRVQDPFIPVEKVAFYWDGRWQRKRGRDWVDSSYAHTRKFYKQLKKSKGVTKAKNFRREVEKKRGHLVPHRELRDRIKNDPKTREATRELRETASDDVFLLFLDGDTQSLRSEESIGPFSVIERHANKASIISAGYTVEEPNNPALELGVLADIAVRNATAKHFPNGVYYPEPCTAIRISEDEDTILQDFSDGSTMYDSPKEMPILIDKVLRARELNPAHSMKFDSDGSIVTETPKRMSDRGKFDCPANSDGQLLFFGIHDIRRMRNVSQTHYDPFHWAENLLPALNIKKKVDLFGEELESSIQIKQLTIGILARVFKLHDPIEKALEISRIKKFNFVEAMSDLLNRGWHSPCEKVPPPGQKKYKCETVVQTLLKNIGDSQEKLREALGSVLEKTTRSRRVFDAAKDSGKAVWELFANNLWNKGIEKMMLANLEIYSNNELPGELESLEENPLLLKILRKETFTRADYLSYKGTAVTPLHMAALTGNITAVEQIISYGDSRVSKDFQDRIPYIYGLYYCHENGIDVDLLLALIGNETTPENLRHSMTVITPGLQTEIEESDTPMEKRIELLARLECNPSTSFEEEIRFYDASIERRNEWLEKLKLEPILEPIIEEDSDSDSDDSDESLERLIDQLLG